MVVYTVVCSECGTERLGRNGGGGVEPYRRECVNCGGTSFEVPASRDGG